MPTVTTQSTVLLVEDDHLVRRIVTESLELAGYVVVAVPDGEEALQVLPSVQPDLILSDLRMPKCSGLELLERVRRIPAHSLKPFIIMSAKADVSDQRLGMSQGADDYVTKPFLTEDLLKTIEVRLARSAMFSNGISRQRQFLSRVLPHELRTPLGGVLGYADLMTQLGQAGQTLSVEELVEYGTEIQHSGQRLLRVAEDLSLWAWFETQSEMSRGGEPESLTQYTITQAEVETWIQATVDNYARKGDVTLDVSSAIVTVPTAGLEFVIRHLVENALKFSRPASPVRITGVLQGGRYEIAFRDSGRGMSEEEIACVGMLRQFQREQHEQQGMGLGFALVSSFAMLAGGELIVSRNHSGPGLTVRLMLPVAGVSPAK